MFQQNFDSTCSWQLGGVELDTESELQVAGMLLLGRTSQQQSYDHRHADGSVKLGPLDFGNSLHIPYGKVQRQSNLLKTMHTVSINLKYAVVTTRDNKKVQYY